ncbi:MAG TPA: ATP-binding protein [Polyangiaceae bacterium]
MDMLASKAKHIGELAYTRESVRADAEVREVAERFERTSDLDAIAVVAAERDFGLVVRSRLTSRLGRQFGYALYARKPISLLAERDVLACDVRQDPVQVIATAVHREAERIYDDIVLTDAGGYYGLVSMRLLMAHSKDLLIQSMAEVGVLVQQNRTLDQLNRLQGEFVANMTHELRAPLNTMLGVADLLTSDPAIPEVRRRDVKMLLTRGRDLLGIVNNFLEMHRIEAGDVEPFFELVEPRALLDDCLDAASYLSEGRPIDLDREYSELPPQIVTDPVLLRRVLTNLLSNAVKFTDRGNVTLLADGLAGELRIRVRDTGLGISAVDLPNLFRKFGQLSATKTKRHSGTGLGLAIVKNLVELLGGRVDVRSEIGFGSEFTVHLPAPDPNQVVR